jgi:hypothetical protein
MTKFTRGIIASSFFLLAVLFSTIAHSQPLEMDKPDEIPLGGLIRSDTFNSPLGPVFLRWTREVEGKFGRDPLRATIEASRAASRVLRLSSVPSELNNLYINWNIVFMDSVSSSAKLPKGLIDQCHPGWMLPPAHIYIVGERVSEGCGGQQKIQKVADKRLSQVVVHELAHAIEYQMLGAEQWRDRSRAEGFATWFELLASRHSSLLDESMIKASAFKRARESIHRYPGNNFVFDGSSEAYARMAIYFSWLESRYGLAEVFRVYDDIRNEPEPFLSVLVRKYATDISRLDKEVLKYIDSQGM